MNAVQEETVYLKNASLMMFVGQHVIMGWDRDNKWQAGVLRTVMRPECCGCPPESECDHDAMIRSPILWKLEILGRPGNRVVGYERVKEVFFVTTDVKWWCPATPKEEKAP